MNVDELKADALESIARAHDATSLAEVEVAYLGRKRGVLTGLLKSLKDMAEEDRREQGPRLQLLKRELAQAIAFRAKEIEGIVSARPRDVTLPGYRLSVGHLHPLTLVEDEIRRIFTGMNFSVIEGSELETEQYNFDALNIPPSHPARDMWDTFWVKGGRGSGAKPGDRLLLRTHTSPMQVRYMETQTPPFRIIVPGRVFRYEATDASHETNFHQVEGLVVGDDVSLAQYKFIIEEFFREFFAGSKIEFRYRPSYFPFVEPGVEMDVRVGKKWLEVMGAGMVHPSVFEAAGYNPREFRGFAFGMGVERLAMIKYGIPDIRLFYTGGLRFIEQF